MKKLLLYIPLFAALSFSTMPARRQGDPSPVIFALINEGKTIEPIARVENGSLLPAYEGENNIGLTAFAKLYYKPGTVFSITTGGKVSGKATVVKNDPASECGAAMADVKSNSPLLPLKRNEQTLATSFRPAKPASGIRRNATAAEKAAIEKLVRAEFNKKIILVKNLKQVKLTVFDVDNDKVPEIAGTYICSPMVKQRALIFFIAAKNKKGGFTFQYSDVQEIGEADTMSQDITAVDDGIYQETLLDILDIDNNGVSCIFTTKPSFEGAGFFVYKRNGNAWEKTFEVSNYHCAY